MPYARKRFRKRRRRRKGKSTKRKVVTLSSRQARTKKYDSRIEVVIARVARQEIQRGEIRLLKRMYLFTNYDATTNAFANNGKRIDWTGQVVPVSRVAQADIEFVSTASPADLPETAMIDESDVSALGVGRGTYDLPSDGFRVKDKIRVKGFSLKIRCFRHILAAGSDPSFDNSILHWRLVHVRSEKFVTDPLYEPYAEELLPIRPWGYSAKLDPSEANVSANMKYRVLMKGSIKLKPSLLNCHQTNRSRYWSPKKPLLLQYEPDDQTGEKPMKGALFLVFRSNIPDGEPYEIYHPWVQAVCKLNYTDC